MSITWMLDKIKGQTMKLWRFEAIEELQPQQLRENVYLAPTLRRETKSYLMVG